MIICLFTLPVYALLRTDARNESETVLGAIL